MKTILWATLTANGNYQRNDPRHPPPPEALADFAAHASRTGNFVVGRTTFEAFAAQQAASGGPPRAPDASGMGAPLVVVVSSKPPVFAPASAPGPREALALLAARGFTSALVAGGAMLHNAFLAEDLVDELVVDVSPMLEDAGFSLVLPAGRQRSVRLVESRALCGGVVQLRYDLRAG